MINQDQDILTEGLNNWKLRLILSALLSIIGLGFFVSMALGLFINLSVYDQSLVGIAIFMVGVPAYLIISNLAGIDKYTIAGFLNQTLTQAGGQAEVLLKLPEELEQEELERRKALEELFNRQPLYSFLPDKPVRQAYAIFLATVLLSFGIWFIG